MPSPLDTEAPSTSPTREINWGDFRDHLTTADKEGHRKWLYPRKPKGRYYRARTWVSYLLLLVMFAGPFVRIGGNPLLLLNIVERRFVILGQVFWPQDVAIFAIGMLLFLTGIAVFTAAFGRLWCGWTCPQTLLMEMVFRKIEYLIEGDATEQRALARAPWTARKIAKKTGKQAVFLALSFIIGNTLLSYIIGTEQLFQIITDDPRRHLEGLGFMVAFTLIFYGIFARFREQACTFICPYGRLQASLLDENTIIVAYNHRRGEQRGRLHRAESRLERQQRGMGDCIDCRQCVSVCPTGIDIRDGTQMECVHCTACIDACDAVMRKVQLPTGLIGYTSLNGIERGEGLKVAPRLIGYTAVLIGLGCVLAAMLLTRADVGTTLLRAPGALYNQTADNRINNLYLLKVINKTNHEIRITLKLENMEGEVNVIGNELVVPAQGLANTSVLITLPQGSVHSANTGLVLGAYQGTKRVQTLRTVFVGPRDDTNGTGKDR